MRLYLLSIVFLAFSVERFFCYDQNFTAVPFLGSTTIQLNVTDYDKIVQVYSMFENISVISSVNMFANVTQLSMLLRPQKESYKLTLISHSGNMKLVTVWIRLMGAREKIIPGICDFANNSIVGNKLLLSSLMKIKFSQVGLKVNGTILCDLSQKDVMYELWVYPYFPNGLFNSWSGDVTNVGQHALELHIVDFINQRLNGTKIDGSGVMLHSVRNKNEFLIARRQTYISIFVIKAKYGAFSVEYPPIMVHECLVQYAKFNQSCPVLNADWNATIYFGITALVLFLLGLHRYRSIQNLVFGWILLVIVGSACLIRFWPNDMMMKMLIWGIAPFFGLVLAILFGCCCLSESSLEQQRTCRTRLATVCTILTVIFAVLSIVWSSLLTQYEISTYMLAFSSICAILVLFSLLIYLYNATASFGAVFIGLLLISAGFSIIFAPGTVLTYILSDLFFHILQTTQTNYERILYITIPIRNDLITFIVCGILTFIMGFCTVQSLRKSKIDENNQQSTDETPLLGDQSGRPFYYVFIYDIRRTFQNIPSHFNFHSNRVSPSAPQDQPPPYEY